MVGFAGSDNDFLLSLPSLKSYLYQFKGITTVYDIRILNLSLSLGDLEATYHAMEFAPDIVCFSCYAWNFKKIEGVAKQIKKIRKEIKIVIGGPEIKGDYDKNLFDYVVEGDGEEALYKILTGKTPPDVPFPFYPSPYLSGCIPDVEFEKKELRANFETQRGCSNACAYCLYHRNSGKIEYRNPDVIVDEIEYCNVRGVKIGKIIDANLLSDKEHIKKIFNGLIERKVSMKLNFDMVPRYLDEEIAGMFKKYISMSKDNGLIAGIGLQTLNKESCKAIRRYTPTKEIDKAVELLSKAGAVFRIDTILGLPFETFDSYLELIDYVISKMKEGKCYMGAYVLKLLPNTDLTADKKKFGLVEDENSRQHDIYFTKDMDRESMVDCLRITSIAYRIFNPFNVDGKSRVRNKFFEIADEKRWSYVDSIRIIKNKFCVSSHLPSDSRFRKEDYPDAENYYLRDLFNDLLDDELLEVMDNVSNTICNSRS